MHDVVMLDDGIPRLQKRGYGLKGYKQVLRNYERLEYEV
jgi:hypothetical protein